MLLHASKLYTKINIFLFKLHFTPLHFSRFLLVRCRSVSSITNSNMSNVALAQQEKSSVKKPPTPSSASKKLGEQPKDDAAGAEKPNQGKFQPGKYKGKKVMTQLDKGDAELIKEETAKGPAPANIQFMQVQEQDYTDIQTRNGIFDALQQVKTAKGEKPSPQLNVLNVTGKMFLNPKYKPVLLKGETATMNDAEMAQINVNAYRAELEALRKYYQEKGMKEQVECIEKILKALDKKQTLTVAELKQIFEGIAMDVNMTKIEAEAVLDQLVKMGMLNKADANEIRQSLPKNDTIKANDLAQKASPAMVIRPDGTVGSRKGYTGSSFRIPKNLPTNQPPVSRKQVAGQLCGPSRPFMQNIAQVKESTVSANFD